jgi:hypothetical protein
MVDDRKAVPIEAVTDVGDIARRYGRSNRPHVQDVIESDVVDIAGEPGDFFATFLAEDIPTDSTTPQDTGHSMRL